MFNCKASNVLGTPKSIQIHLIKYKEKHCVKVSEHAQVLIHTENV